MHQHLTAHGIDPHTAGLQVRSMLEINPATGRFTGEGSDSANKWLRREYRKGFEVPEIV